jgi:four helix bundle protein
MLKIYGELLVMIREVVPIIGAISKHDASLADQMRRAAQSAVLNVAEGSYSRGRNAGARFQSALASMREALSCIEVAVAFGYVQPPPHEVLDRIDKIQATLYRLV